MEYIIATLIGPPLGYFTAMLIHKIFIWIKDNV
jgi:hypothetical protein